MKYTLLFFFLFLFDTGTIFIGHCRNSPVWWFKVQYTEYWIKKRGNWERNRGKLLRSKVANKKWWKIPYARENFCKYHAKQAIAVVMKYTLQEVLSVTNYQLGSKNKIQKKLNIHSILNTKSSKYNGSNSCSQIRLKKLISKLNLFHQNPNN